MGKNCTTTEEQSTKSSEVVNVDEGTLFEDLIRDILLRLPWQSVNRFKSVSKNWLRLVSEPSFVKDFQFQNHDLLGFLHSNLNRVKFCPIPLLENPICVRDLKRTSFSFPQHCLGVTNLSNGFVLCWYRHYRQPIYVTSYFVYNPITEEQLHLPPLSQIYMEQPLDRQNRFLVTGFQFHYDSETPSFIVAQLVNREKGLQVYFFSSETFKWTSTLHDLRHMFRGDESFALSGPSTFYRGSLHWVSEPLGVVSYSVKKQQFSFRRIPAIRDDQHVYRCMFNQKGDKHIPIPPHCRCRYLGECLDKLLYIQVAGDSQLYLWKLEDYHRNKWSLRQSIIIENVPMPFVRGSIVGFDRRDDQVLFLKLNRMILSYHLRSKELTMLYEVPSEDYDNLHFFCAYELPKSVPFLFYKSYFSHMYGSKNVLVSNELNFPE
ncbi:F-box protein At5g07610-like [Telopea speciosissima]|uniref:F-box protein At5g07610-like n=1 Tax=Telopea speciosissima TaxID=54955 RepID=UPI001CC36083|nr:F-box protein At5g07610-like [Telopea speciosissima]